jgi:hypothetical protein
MNHRGRSWRGLRLGEPDHQIVQPEIVGAMRRADQSVDVDVDVQGEDADHAGTTR